ncbi:hypothetical protein Dimus_037867 [Dionaea muscipula]
MKNPLKHESKEMRKINTTITSNSTNRMKVVLPQASKLESQVLQPKNEPQSSKEMINSSKIPKLPYFFLLLLPLLFPSFFLLVSPCSLGQMGRKMGWKKPQEYPKYITYTHTHTTH